MDINLSRYPQHFQDAVLGRTSSEYKESASQAIPDAIATPQDHWLKAHAYNANWNEQEARDRYKTWEATIPNLSCSCRSEWRKIAKANPPVFSSSFDYYRWFWERHNDVNAKIREEKGGHPHVEWSKCCRLYGYPEEWLKRPAEGSNP